MMKLNRTHEDDVMRFVRDRLSEDVLKGDSFIVDVFRTNEDHTVLVDCGGGDMFKITITREV